MQQNKSKHQFEAYIDLFGVGLVPFHKRYVYCQEFTLVTYEKLKVKQKNLCLHNEFSLRHPCQDMLTDVTHPLTSCIEDSDARKIFWNFAFRLIFDVF